MEDSSAGGPLRPRAVTIGPASGEARSRGPGLIRQQYPLLLTPRLARAIDEQLGESMPRRRWRREGVRNVPWGATDPEQSARPQRIRSAGSPTLGPDGAGLRPAAGNRTGRPNGSMIPHRADRPTPHEARPCDARPRRPDRSRAIRDDRGRPGGEAGGPEGGRAASGPMPAGARRVGPRARDDRRPRSPAETARGFFWTSRRTPPPGPFTSSLSPSR
jgi:hypothetical protein